VESEPGKGTTFDVLLPRSAPVASDPLLPPAQLGAPGGTETVLLVEDDEAVRDAAARVLRSGGYRVVAAAGAEGAVEAARAETRPPALLVTDVVMPGTTGRGLADQLRREQPGLRVLFLSGYAQDVIATHGVLDPTESFLAKPFTATSLLAKVRKVLDAG
jgi:CheY-like chemotaxis protein